MQPTINLQLNEFTHFDADSSTAAVLPSDATEPTGNFADLLKSGLEVVTDFETTGGRILPEEGQLLPSKQLFNSTAGGLPGDLIPGEVSVDVTGNGSGDGVESPALVLPIAHLPVKQPGSELGRSPLAAAGDVLRTAIEEPFLQRQKSLNTLPVNSTAAFSGDNLRDPVTAAQTRIPGRVAANPEVRRGRAPGFDDLSARALASGNALAGTSTVVAQSESLIPRAVDLSALDAQPQIVQASGNPQSQSPAIATPATTGSLEINTPVQDLSWGQRIGEQVLLLANNKLQNAEIRLSPAELGPLHVKISLEDGATNITFHAQHAVTREAIEQALPKLRELLSENGLTLGEANIDKQGVNQEQERANQDTAEASDGSLANVVEAKVEDDVTQQRINIRPNGLLDTFV